MIIAISIAGVVFGQEAAQGYLLDQIRGLVGVQGGEAIETMIAHANQPRTGTLAAVLGVITLLAGAAGVVGQLQDATSAIFKAPSPSWISPRRSALASKWATSMGKTSGESSS